MTWQAGRSARWKRPRSSWKRGAFPPRRFTKASGEDPGSGFSRARSGNRRDLGGGAQVGGRRAVPGGLDRGRRRPGRGAYFAVTNSVSSIGRGLDQSICLNFGDASISRSNHAAIAYDAEQNRFFLGHGNKSNIVRRNGQPVLSTEELVNGDAIRIGKTTLRFVALCGPDFTWGPDPEEGGLNDV
jgi:hypothetical protein